MALDLTTLIRGRTPMSGRDMVRAGAGALLGIAATGVLARVVADGSLSGVPLLIPPMGASAVLVFAVPASPLAQPRQVVFGNMLSAVVGVTCALMIPNPVLAAGCAVGLAILCMSLLGCLHPPGGAVALAAALAGAGEGALGYGYALVPVGLCSALLVTAAMAYNTLTGRSYPHRAPASVSPHKTTDAPPPERVGYTRADLDAALARYGELLDVSREDLDVLFRQVELEAHQRLHAQIRCDEVMSLDVVAVDADQGTESALATLQKHDLRAAPVVDGERRVLGMVRRAELVGAPGRTAADVLDPLVHEVAPDAPIQQLLPLLSSGLAHEAMVVDETGALLGIITQTDLLAVLYRAHIVESIGAQRAA